MSASVAVEPAFLDINFQRAAVVWWAVFWRMVLLNLGAGLILGLIEGAILALLGVSSPTIRLVTSISGFLLGIPVSIYVVTLGLRKRYREFTIRLLPVPR